MEMMLDSGSAVSLVRKDMITSQMKDVMKIPPPPIKLVTASGDELAIMDYIQVPVQLQCHKVIHNFVVVNTLITPAILGIDFLQQHHITINFADTPVKISVSPNAAIVESDPTLRRVLEAERDLRTKHCAVVAMSESMEDKVEDYAIPAFAEAPPVEFPECELDTLQTVVNEFQQLFKTTPGKTDVCYHYIPTTEPPVHVPPRCIPVHYHDEVLRQLQIMLEQGIIKRSNSPWMAPAVFVRKNPAMC